MQGNSCIFSAFINNKRKICISTNFNKPKCNTTSTYSRNRCTIELDDQYVWKINCIKNVRIMTLCGASMVRTLDNVEWGLMHAIVGVLGTIKEATTITARWEAEGQKGAREPRWQSCPTLSQYLPMYTGLINVLTQKNMEAQIAADISINLCQAKIYQKSIFDSKFDLLFWFHNYK